MSLEDRIMENMQKALRESLAASARTRIFKRISIEAHGSCNRRCFDCLRQNNPLGPPPTGPAENSRLPWKLIVKILKGADELGFKGAVGLHHHSEPLMDLRIVELSKLVRDYGMLPYICTNGDFLTSELAKRLDGLLTHVLVSTYEPMTEEKIQERRDHFQSLFSTTKVNLAAKRIITHYSPRGYQKSVEKHKDEKCLHPRIRFIIKHTGEMALCCMDINTAYNLGSIYDHTVEELWWSKEHIRIMKVLCSPGSRAQFDWCSKCPMGSDSVRDAVERAAPDR